MQKFDQLMGTCLDSNMVKPVLFMQAVDGAFASIGQIDHIVELGPHPALRGPTFETIQSHARAIRMRPDPEHELLGQVLRNVRCLLKAGGYLIVLELIPSLGPLFRIFLVWPSARDKPASSLAVDPVEWDNLLRSPGFSGIDTSITAVDNRVTFLREPLSVLFPTPTSETMIPDLTILGGSSLKTSALTKKLVLTLGPYYDHLRTVRSLQEFCSVEISPSTSCEGVKKLVQHRGILNWVAQGFLADNLYMNMGLGLLRGAVRDNPALDYLVFDIEDERKANYMAANTFMVSLAEQRRLRGLAAAVKDIGPIFGVGNISRPAEGSTISTMAM
ncbi:hypothetical protein F4775DRAFT_588685 [Biscogniauxia sp. FL1348]|nr:hypothetical protein F4775DRAFT_588685 [Biscogniauxia sp. FL1348]